MAVLWPRGELVQFGALHWSAQDGARELNMTWNHLKRLRAHVLKGRNSGALNAWLRYSTWSSIATVKFRMSEEQAWLCFETFDAVTVTSKEDRMSLLKVMESCKTQQEKVDQRRKFSVELLQFLVFLGMQLCARTSLLPATHEAVIDTKWPPNGDKKKLKGEDVSQLSLVQHYLPYFLEVLTETGLTTFDSGPSGGEGEVSLESVKALGLLVAGMDAAGVVRPLEELASLHSEAKAAGFSKLTQMFKTAKLSSWFHRRLSLCPFGTSSMLGGQRDRKTVVYRSARRGKVLSNTSLSPEGCRRLLLFHVTSQVVAKGPGDASGSIVTIQRCQNTQVYILAPLKFVSIEKCSNCQIVLGPVEQVVAVTNCEEVILVTFCRKLHISSTVGSVFYLHCATRPVVFGGCSSLHFAPYNTYYPQLGRHLEETTLQSAAANHWDNPLVMGEASSAPLWNRLPVEHFRALVVPFDTGPGATHANPSPLPDEYRMELKRRADRLASWTKAVQTARLSADLQTQLQLSVQLKFKEWLEHSGHSKEIANLQPQSSA